MKTLHLANNKCGNFTRHSMHVGVVTMLAISALFILYHGEHIMCYQRGLKLNYEVTTLRVIM